MQIQDFTDDDSNDHNTDLGESTTHPLVSAEYDEAQSTETISPSQPNSSVAMSTGSFSNIESSARPEPGTQDRRHGRYQGRKRRNNRHQRKARGPIYQNDDGFTSSMQGLGKVNFSTGSSQSTFENTSFMRCGRSINSIYCPHASSPRELFNFCDQSQEFESCSKPVEAEYTTGRDIDLFTNSYGAYITNSSFYVMDKCIGAVEMPDNPSPEFLRAIEAICAAGAPRT